MFKQSQQISNDTLQFKTIEILLESIFRREQATIQMILVTLYEVGSYHLVQDRIPIALLRIMARPMAKASKPVFGTLGYIWFQKNAPLLIAEYLFAQVQPKAEETVEISSAQAMSLPNKEVYSLRQAQQEIQRLERTMHYRTVSYCCSLALVIFLLILTNAFVLL